MKYNTMMALAVCGVLAFAVTGCKYDDAAGGDDLSSGKDVQTVDDGKIGDDVTTDPGAVIDESGKSATGLKFDQDPNYVRCTDVDFQPVYFGFDASNLASEELAKIEAVGAHLQQNPDRVVMVEGNCDERGSNEYNLELGSLRAISIRDYLATLGIDGNRIQTKSYGEEKPAVSGSGESAWAKNRRGEFAVFKHK